MTEHKVPNYLLEYTLRGLHEEIKDCLKSIETYSDVDSFRHCLVIFCKHYVELHQLMEIPLPNNNQEEL